MLAPMTDSAGAFDGRMCSSRPLWICAAAIAVAATSCGAPPRVRDDIHRDEWYELRSQHIQLTTDVPLDRAQEYTRELEQSWRALTMMYVVIAPWATPPDAPFSVIHLSSCSDYHDIGLKNSTGFVFSSRVLKGERIVVTCEQPNGNHSIFLHELTHILNGRCIPLAPPWVNEGLAMYFETMEMADGRVVVGKLPPHREHLWRTPALLPKLPDVLGLDNAAFRDDQNARYYLAAWKLVHLLNNTSQDYRNRLRGYLAMLNGDHVRKDAWEQAFHGIPPEHLAEEYGVYQQRPKLLLWTASYKLENPPAVTVRQLRAGEAHVVWAHLLSRVSPEEALRQIDLAAQADRFWPDVFYWRALLLPWLRRPGADEQAAAALREYRSRRPEDARGWHLLLDRELDRVVPADHLGLEDIPPAGIEDLEPIAKGLVARAQQPYDLNAAAWYYAMARQADTGLPLAIRSVQRDPGCADCWDTLALLYFQKGDVARARLAQERAVNMYGDGRILPGVRLRLQRYRAAASAALPASVDTQ
jgi:hypothetical protein